jgi:hypothetical protein
MPKLPKQIQARLNRTQKEVNLQAILRMKQELIAEMKAAASEQPETDTGFNMKKLANAIDAFSTDFAPSSFWEGDLAAEAGDSAKVAEAQLRFAKAVFAEAEQFSRVQMFLLMRYIVEFGYSKEDFEVRYKEGEVVDSSGEEEEEQAENEGIESEDDQVRSEEEDGYTTDSSGDS